MTSLYFFKGIVLFLSDNIDTEIHQHHLMEIFISLRDPLDLEVNNISFKGHNIILAPDEKHRLRNSNTPYILLLLDSETLAARKISKKYLKDSKVELLDDLFFNEYTDEFRKLFKTNPKIEDIGSLCNRVITKLSDTEKIEINEFDPRIKEALEIMNRLPEKKIKIKDLAYSVCLSESRLIHLFTNQLGIPIRRYLLWLKLLDAINLIIKGKDFTTTSYETGFSDSAHLSRTFRKMFGLKLFEIFKNYKNSQIIQVKIN